jgi:hypothetical protein
MKKNEAQVFCMKWLAAWTGNHPDMLAEFYSDDAIYIDPANREGLRGRGQMIEYFRKLLAANPNWRWEALELYPTDLGFILKWRATIPVGSENIIEKGMDIVEIRDNTITRNEVYFDRSLLVEMNRKLKQSR